MSYRRVLGLVLTIICGCDALRHVVEHVARSKAMAAIAAEPVRCPNSKGSQATKNYFFDLPGASVTDSTAVRLLRDSKDPKLVIYKGSVWNVWQKVQDQQLVGGVHFEAHTPKETGYTGAVKAEFDLVKDTISIKRTITKDGVAAFEFNHNRCSGPIRPTRFSLAELNSTEDIEDFEDFEDFEDAEDAEVEDEDEDYEESAEEEQSLAEVENVAFKSGSFAPRNSERHGSRGSRGEKEGRGGRGEKEGRGGRGEKAGRGSRGEKEGRGGRGRGEKEGRGSRGDKEGRGGRGDGGRGGGHGSRGESAAGKGKMKGKDGKGKGKGKGKMKGKMNPHRPNGGPVRPTRGAFDCPMKFIGGTFYPAERVKRALAEEMKNGVRGDKLTVRAENTDEVSLTPALAKAGTGIVGAGGMGFLAILPAVWIGAEAGVVAGPIGAVVGLAISSVLAMAQIRQTAHENRMTAAEKLFEKLWCMSFQNGCAGKPCFARCSDSHGNLALVPYAKAASSKGMACQSNR